MAKAGPIKFHQLDISSIKGAKESAEVFKKVESRLDILVANAGISMAFRDELSPDGYEKTFSTNHLGHMAFIMTLLGKSPFLKSDSNVVHDIYASIESIEASATKNGEARIVVISSYGYKSARKLDYEMLSTAKPGDGRAWADAGEAFMRYCDSKLANLHFTRELASKLQARGVQNVYVNCCHPGTAGSTTLGSGGLGKVGDFAEPAIRGVLKLTGNTNEDAAKTQTWLAASKEVRDKGVKGEYYAPEWSWTLRWLRCKTEPLTSLGNDQGEQKKLWEFSEEGALAKAGA